MVCAITGTPMIIFFYIQRLLYLYEDLLSPIKYDILFEESLEIDSLNIIKWYSLSWDTTSKTVYFNFNIFYSKEFYSCLEELKKHPHKLMFFELGLFNDNDGHSNILIVFNDSYGLKAIRLDPHGPITLEEYLPNVLDKKLSELLEEHDILFIESSWWSFIDSDLNASIQPNDNFCSTWVSFIMEELILGLMEKNIQTIDLISILKTYKTILMCFSEDNHLMVSKYKSILEIQTKTIPIKLDWKFKTTFLTKDVDKTQFIVWYNTMFIQYFYCSIYELLTPCNSYSLEKSQLIKLNTYYKNKNSLELEDLSDELIEKIYENLKILAKISKKNNTFHTLFPLGGRSIHYNLCKHFMENTMGSLY